MKTYHLTCIECPIGCSLEVGVENNEAAFVKGNACPRGKVYGENEVICPRRIVTSTVRLTNGKMLPVKTERAVKKTDMFAVMKKINALKVQPPVQIGDVLMENISEDIALIATGNAE